MENVYRTRYGDAVGIKARHLLLVDNETADFNR